MFATVAKKIFGTANDRRLKTYRPKVAAINALEPEVAKLSDERTARPRPRHSVPSSPTGKTLDDILVPAFATVREAAKRASASAISMSSSSAAWCCTKAPSPR